METTEKTIPWEDAKALAEKYGQNRIIIFCMGAGSDHHVVTWGANIHDSDIAATGGNNLKNILGWPEEYCNAQSAKVEAILAVNKALYAACLDLKTHMATAVFKGSLNHFERGEGAALIANAEEAMVLFEQNTSKL